MRPLKPRRSFSGAFFIGGSTLLRRYEIDGIPEIFPTTVPKKSKPLLELEFAGGSEGGWGKFLYGGVICRRE